MESIYLVDQLLAFRRSAALFPSIPSGLQESLLARAENHNTTVARLPMYSFRWCAGIAARGKSQPDEILR